MRTRLVAVFVAFGIAGWGAAMLAQQGTPPPRPGPARVTPARIDFARQVQPILERHCLECHSQTKRKGGLSLAAYVDILEGGKDGAIVRPGQSAASMWSNA